MKGDQILNGGLDSIGKNVLRDKQFFYTERVIFYREGDYIFARKTNRERITVPEIDYMVETGYQYIGIGCFSTNGECPRPFYELDN